MALWKKPSKYKNTIPEPPKREDLIYDLPVGSLTSSNNGVKASSSLLAFHIDGEGGKLGVLPLDAKGRKLRQDLTIICAHPDRVGDFEFSPFHENILATCCVRDEPVKLFKLDINHNIPSSCSNADATIAISDTPAEFLTFHPTANNVVTVAAGHSVFICDINKERPVLSFRDFDDKLNYASWNGDGKTLAVISRSQLVSLVDPRSSTPIIGTVSSHAGIGRENRVLHLGDSGKFLTSGFTKQKNREILLYDERSISKPLTSLQLDASTGILIPLYDSDAKLLFLAGKGSTKIHMFEVLDGTPYFVEEASYTAADVQTLGACLVPKVSLNVMHAEVDRLYQLSKNRLSPISYKVPRKTFRDFHSDLYPLTYGHVPGLESDQWFSGDNKLPPKFSLDPEKRHLFDQFSRPTTTTLPSDAQEPVRVDHSYNKPSSFDQHPPAHHGLKEKHEQNGDAQVRSELTSVLLKFDRDNKDDEKRIRSTSLDDVDAKRPPEKIIEPPASRPTTGVTVGRSYSSVGDTAKKLQPAAVNSEAVRLRRPSPRARLPERAQTIIAGVRQSKFRHVTAAKDVLYVNLRKVNTRIPLESNGCCVSPRWAAVPLADSGGVIAVFDLNKNGKLREGVIPGLENGANITDLQWCPFDENVLAVGCENGHVNFWRVPENGVHAILTEPDRILQAHNDKICCLRYNPVASDVLATAASDCSLIVWDLRSFEARIRVTGHDQPVLSLTWNNYGNRLATVSKDSNLRVFDVRGSDRQEQNVLQSTKSARVLFVCNDRMLLISSFSKSSDRTITLYDAETLSPIYSKIVDISSQPLIPQYDNDSSVVFLTGKGDRTIHMFEISEEPPFFMELSQYASPTAHQAISFCPKYLCNVRKVEFAVGCRLCLSELERLSFTVPRRRMECFQNDIFPESLVTWQPLQNADDWFSCVPVVLNYVSLKPDDMELLYKELAESRPSRAKPATTAKSTVDHVVTSTKKENVQEQIVVQQPPVADLLGLESKCESGHAESILFLDTTSSSSLLDGSAAPKSMPPPMKPSRNKDKKLLEPDNPERRMFEISESMSKRMDLIDAKPLEQDKMEGVNEAEWELL